MSFSLKVISGVVSSATQYHALIHPDTCTKYKIIDAYMRLTKGEKSLIVHVKSDASVAKESIAIDPKTHAMTLYVAGGDSVMCTIVTEIASTDRVVIRMRKNNSITSYPVLKEELYVAPGHVILLPVGLGTVVEGTGLYKYNPNAVMSELLGNSKSLEYNKYLPGEELVVVAEPTVINIDFCHMGIGGLKEQMTTLIRQVLISQIINRSMREKYNVKDIRGILLHGPPGTGKTLIARNIGKIIPNSVIQKVNGPELSSKFYGETESNVRRIFEDAKVNPNKLHVVIFDEIDAIGRKRGDSSSNIDDKVLTQLLTMIDGLDSANNVLIIGITNRKDVLDPALTRAGRLECHIEIPLPTEAGRMEILDIYLNPLRVKNLVDKIDSSDWARRLDGYSGADIESLIGRAKNLTLLRNCDIDDNNIKPRNFNKDNSGSVTETLAPVTSDDLMNAFRAFQPTFSKNDDIVQRYVANYPLIHFEGSAILGRSPENLFFGTESQKGVYDDGYNTLLSQMNDALGESMTKPYVLHHEISDEENRALICHIAYSLKLPYVRYVSYNDFLGKNSAQNCNILNDAYINCLQAERAVLILDSLSDVGDRALNLRERFIINNPLTKGKQLIIISIAGV